MDFSLILKNSFSLTTAERIENFLEYFEDEDTRGITVSEEKAKYILESVGSSSKEHGRIILDGSIAQRVALRFSKSDFLNDYNFAAVVSAVIEQMFRVQSETNESFTDRELIESFFNFFESRNCAGSISLLTDYATQIIERYNRLEGDELNTDDLSFTTFDFRGFKDDGKEGAEDENQ